MDRVEIHGSSNISSVGFNPQNNTLEIGFRRKAGGESVYAYSGVPIEVWHDLLQAASRGGFFASHIKGVYPATKIQ